MWDDYIKSLGVDVSLVNALIHVESGGNPFRTRFEPASDRYLYFYREHASRLWLTPETERINQMQSWGLMQVMGFVAREHNYDDYLVKLCDPKLGLLYGVKHIKKFLGKYGNEPDAIAAYNAGSARKNPSGMYINQPYVDKVNIKLLELRKLH